MSSSEKHLENLRKNIKDIHQLLDLHKKIGGGGSGRRYGLKVLNKSAIVLLVACWEAFIEDLASNAFEVLITNSKNISSIPSKIKSNVAEKIKASKNDLAMWDLAETGWQAVLEKHKQNILKEYIEGSSFNTPKEKLINNLFKNIIGLRKLSNCWQWQSAPQKNTAKKLEILIILRGEIAHRVSTKKSIVKDDVVDLLDFIYRLATKTHNCVNNFLTKHNNNKKVWRTAIYKKSFI